MFIVHVNLLNANPSLASVFLTIIVDPVKVCLRYMMSK